MRKTLLSLIAFIAVSVSAIAGNTYQIQNGQQTIHGIQTVWLGSPQTSLVGSAQVCQLGGGAGLAGSQCGLIVQSNVTLQNLTVYTDTAQGVGQTVTVIISSGTVGGSYTNSSVTCTLSNANTCNDLSHNLQLTAGQAWYVNVVFSGTAASGHYTFGVQIVY